ncbi:nucleotidyltransferase domain-containing protein [bacterium]|nr:nucleotidyltransferase domain-containing protein [bacterium]
MDFGALKSLAIQLRHRLGTAGVHVDGVILYGSRASGRQRPDSDIDVAVLSRDFGKDRYAEGVLVNLHAHRVHADLEAVPIGLHEWFEPFPASPLVHEIQMNGVFLI